MTTDLHSTLSKLGLAQYIERFDDEGFETWDTVLDITESDLDALGVKLGHRRILQREIAFSRGLPIDFVTSLGRSRPLEDDREGVGAGDGIKADGKNSTGAGGKRKYRRHPKADEHAPERPPSAYVIFSNRIRTELKPENLSFTAIAKKVGERWQDLPAEEKEPYESEASTAKEKYHSEMADYKTTKSYREYQQYLTEFKAKNNTSSGTPAGAHAESLSGANLRTEGKRPRLAHEETQESMTSGGSVAGDPIEGFDSLSGTKGSRCHRVNSLDSSGPCSTTSGFPSPSSVVSGPAAFRTAVAPFIPLGTASPTSTSSSTPSIHKEPSIGPPIRHSVDSYPEHTSPRSGQRLPPISQFDSRERGQSTTPGPYQGTLGPRLSVERTSPLDQPRRSNRIPSAFKQSHASDTSSRSSMNSSLSGASTAPSSLFSSVVVDEGKRTALSLPPLAAVTAASSLSGSASYATSGRQKVDPLTTHKAPSSAAEQSSQSPFQTSSSTGMKFESLQLPLPHNIAFGQRPLPRPEHEGKLANIFDLQDIPRERNSLKNMTLEQQRFASVTPPDLPGPPQPRHPPHRPALPTLDRSSRRNSQENVLQPNADPLSVLAYAGRLVGRNSHPPPSQ